MTARPRPGAGGVRRRRPTRPSGSRRSSRCSTRETLELAPRFEELRDAGQDDEILRDAIAGELISSEIEIRSGAGSDLHDAIARQREARARLFALASAHGRGARLDGHPSLGRLPRAAEHRHRALPPRRRRPSVRRAAQQHLRAPRPRRRERRRSRGAHLRPPAPGAARRCWRSAPTRRSSRAATAACTPRARRPSPSPSRAAGCPTPTARGRSIASTWSSWSRPGRSSRAPRSGGRSARIWRSAPSRCGSPTLRRPARSPRRSRR